MWEEIGAAILGLIIGGGAMYVRFKNVIKLISDALEDDALTVEELRGIIAAVVKG